MKEENVASCFYEGKRRGHRINTECCDCAVTGGLSRQGVVRLFLQIDYGLGDRQQPLKRRVDCRGFHDLKF